MIPFIDLGRKEYLLDEIEEIFQSKRFIGGKAVSALEEELANRLGTENCVTCGNGTDALQLALRSKGIDRGDRVLVPEYTFWATAEAVVNVGAVPITVDINAADKCMDYELFVRAVDKYSPRAVILVHVLGWCSADLLSFRETCRDRDIILIEDGAQSFGTEINGESVFTGADCITTSFYPAKVLGGCGDGGAVFTRCGDQANLVRRLANHGRADHYSHSEVGWNSRLDSINAQYLLQRLFSIDAEIKERQEIARQYKEELRNETAISVVQAPTRVTENGYLFTIEFDTAESRDTARDALQSKKIATAITYPVPLSSQSAFIKESYQRFSAPSVAESFGCRLLNLPIFPGMTESEQEQVICSLRSMTK